MWCQMWNVLFSFWKSNSSNQTSWKRRPRSSESDKEQTPELFWFLWCYITLDRPRRWSRAGPVRVTVVPPRTLLVCQRGNWPTYSRSLRRWRWRWRTTSLYIQEIQQQLMVGAEETLQLIRFMRHLTFFQRAFASLLWRRVFLYWNIKPIIQGESSFLLSQLNFSEYKWKQRP